MNTALFRENSIYFRNALAVSNYSDILKKISPNFDYLDKFFSKLLSDEEIKLKEIKI